MHESGVIQNTLEAALAQARDRGGRLVSIQIRLGVLAAGSAEHMREHFESEISRRGLDGIELHISEDPGFLGGAEITSVEIGNTVSREAGG